jgi:cytochrome P450
MNSDAEGAPVNKTPLKVSYLSTKDADPYAFYEQLLARGDVHWDAGLNAWLVTSYEACKQAMRQDDVLYDSPHKESRRLLFGGTRSVPALKGAEHERLHGWWLSVFSPRRVAEWRATVIRPIVDACIDRFIAKGRAELADELSERIPIRVIARLMGLPWQDDGFIEDYRRLNHQLVGVLNRRTLVDESDQAEGERVWAEGLAAAQRIEEMVTPYIETRRSGEGDDLISRIWRDGPGLLDEWNISDVMANTRLMLQAGSDTTTYATSNAAYLMLTRPGLMKELQGADDAMAANFVEEVLRLHGPVHLRSREAIADTALAGCPFAKGETVIPIVAAANRDPTHYEHPGEIDLGRKTPRDHLAFHFGPHVCVGAALARAELLETVIALASRMPEMRLDPDAERPGMKGWLMRAYRPLHAVFPPGPQSA